MAGVTRRHLMTIRRLSMAYPKRCAIARRRAVGARRRRRRRRRACLHAQQPHRRDHGRRPDRQAQRPRRGPIGTEAPPARKQHPDRCAATTASAADRSHRCRTGVRPLRATHRAVRRSSGRRQLRHRDLPGHRSAGLRAAGSDVGPPGRPRATVTHRQGPSTNRSASPAPRPPQVDDRRPGHHRRDRGARPCSHRRGVAVAVGEEQHAQPDLRARSRFPRHRRRRTRSSATRTS